MRIPPLVLLTNMKIPGQPEGPISVRCDVIVMIERTSIKIEEQPVPGVRVAKSGPAVAPGTPTVGTCLHLGGGGRCFVEESVEEVTGAINRASASGWLVRLLGLFS